MTALPLPDPNKDPREFRYIPVKNLRVDERKQRDIDPEKVARIANEFDWNRFEALTVARTRHDHLFDVVEGQHRALGAREWDPTIEVPCMILPARTNDKAQSQVALDIVQSRRGHSAYEQWRLRFNAGHPHEIAATQVLDSHGMRVGKSPSSTTIGAVATVRRIIHGGNFTPEYGAELLSQVLLVLKSAFPTHDHESNVSRWDRYMLLAVANIMHAWPDADLDRLVKCIRVKPAIQWVAIGRRADQNMSPDAAIQAAIVTEYNHGKRGNRLT